MLLCYMSLPKLPEKDKLESFKNYIDIVNGIE